MQPQTLRVRRPGYTLLEVLLSLAIGLLLMAALYIALDMHMKFAETGRDVVQQATLARSLMTRIGNDITGSIGPPDLGRLLASGGQGSGGGGTGGQTGATQGGGSTAPTTGATAPTTSATSSSLNITMPTFNLMVSGDATHLTLFVSRVPKPGGNVDPDNPAPNSNGGDVRRISYWLAGGAEPMGLAWQEMFLVTSDDATLPAWDVEDESLAVIADEVRSLTFAYYDGTSWLESWDGSTAPASSGTTMGADGTTSATPSLPSGPPLAIAITLGFAQTGTDQLKQYRHVVAIPTANGIR